MVTPFDGGLENWLLLLPPPNPTQAPCCEPRRKPYRNKMIDRLPYHHFRRFVIRMSLLPATRRGVFMKRTVGMCVLCAMLGGAVGAWLAGQENSDSFWPRAAAQSPLATTSSTAASERPAPPVASDLTPEEERNIRVYAAANRSVVNIDTTMVEVDNFWTHQAEGSGSGAVLDRQGHILTNYHVIDDAQKIDVTLASNNTYPAELVGGDKEHDIAVLKVNAPAAELFPMALGKSDHLRVGQRVYAVGNPFGWDGTMTTGIISSLNRNLPSRVEGRQMQALIQTDAAMNPGNSGGPLLDSSGRMIGMCVAIASHTGQNSGIGFAIPIDRIRSFLPELIEHGHIVRADIGIGNVMETGGAGLVIGEMNPDGPAAKAGLKGFRVVTRQERRGPYVVTTRGFDRSQADRILAFDGEPMHSGVQFRDKVWAHRPGDVVKLTIARNSQQLEVPVTLGGD
jgi:S1-C subfamily serine protease